jgi:hypothetical protein
VCVYVCTCVLGASWGRRTAGIPPPQRATQPGDAVTHGARVGLGRTRPRVCTAAKETHTVAAWLRQPAWVTHKHTHQQHARCAAATAVCSSSLVTATWPPASRSQTLLAQQCRLHHRAPRDAAVCCCVPATAAAAALGSKLGRGSAAPLWVTLTKSGLKLPTSMLLRAATASSSSSAGPGKRGV